MRNNKPMFTVMLGAVTVLGLATGCSSSDDTSDASASSQPTTSTVAGPFGDGCAAVPDSGAGSFDGMAEESVATAASNNPALSTLVAAVGAADLGDTLNSAEGITVFAPANPAFEAIPKKDLNALLADKDALTSVLTYHVVDGQLSPDELAGTHETLQGETLTVTGSGEDFTVNDSAQVICGNVETANATVYIIDGVLAPTK
ncbi:MAG: fasciclin domain-containing protein [Actinomycetes bacterium]